MCSFTTMEARSPKSRHHQCWFLLQSRRENPARAPFLAWTAVSNPWHSWLVFVLQLLSLPSHSLCVCRLPAVMEHSTLPSLFPTRSVVRVGAFQPDPQLHSTAHTGVTVLSSTSEVWAGFSHPGEYQNHQLQAGVSCPSNTEDPKSRF